MDEYLFIAMAKLKADRLRLEREQHEALRSQRSHHQDTVEQADPPPGEWVSHAGHWRTQS